MQRIARRKNMKKSLFLFATAALLLSGCNGGDTSSESASSESASTSQEVVITSEKWDAAFEEVVKNYTYKQSVGTKPQGILEFTENGYHMTSYSYSSEGSTSTNEIYIEWIEDKTYSYIVLASGKWSKTEIKDTENVKKEFWIASAKAQFTFIGRFADFSYDAEKGGYFAPTTSTSLVEYNGESNEPSTATNVLVKFDNDKIIDITFDTTNGTSENPIVANSSLTSIGSTTIDFPIISE